jgi:DNA-binding response OmpR family regulator
MLTSGIGTTCGPWPRRHHSEAMTAKVRVLLVDDDPASVVLARLALSESSLDSELEIATSRREGLARLQRIVEAGDPPDLILVDLNLGDGSGHDLLQFLQRTPEVAGIPAVVLSTSSNPRDMALAREYGAADYLVKPAQFRELVDLMSDLRRVL